jgi:glyoxylase-like metal-dependent hydrolase (beta-lactamase superfamily II)
MSQIALDKSLRADDPALDSERGDHTHEIAADVAYQRIAIVNVAYVGRAGAADGSWVLIDTGLPGMTHLIKNAAEARFGKNSRPAAIIMTHAHSDHAGSVEALANEWQVPVFAHMLEHPYLNGTAAYPPPDKSVGGGLMPVLSGLFPRGPFNVGFYLKPLPADSVPFMPGWRWVHTPGHSPGHISLWREADRLLIVGDAFITTNQESVYAAMVQKPELHGPPMYYTQDWVASEASVKTLESLRPETVVTGHGRAMHGDQMRQALKLLATDFRQIAVPDHGKYVEHPTTAEAGTAYVVKH